MKFKIDIEGGYEGGFTNPIDGSRIEWYSSTTSTDRETTVDLWYVASSPVKRKLLEEAMKNWDGK